jgi:hypothetical protein
MALVGVHPTWGAITDSGNPGGETDTKTATRGIQVSYIGIITCGNGDLLLGESEWDHIL